MNPDAKNPQLCLRNAGANRYIIDVGASRKTVNLSRAQGGTQTTLGSYPLRRDYGADEWLPIELKVVGKTVTVTIDGEEMTPVEDDALKEPGDVMIYGSTNCYFRDIVYVPLDKAASASVPASAAKTTAGDGWRPLFTEAEWRATGQKGYEFKDGLMHVHGGGALLLKQQLSADAAIRARVRLVEGAVDACVKLRADKSKGGYKLNLIGPWDSVLLSQFNPNEQEGKKFGFKKLPKPLKVGDTVLLELRAQGSHLTALVDGVVMIEADDDTLKEPGQWGVSSQNGWFESVEVQPLPAPAAATNPVQIFAGHRYQFVPEKLSWTESKAKAAALGGHLATITSKEENDWVTSAFISALPKSRGVWIGGALGKGRQWTWITNEAFAFANWLPGEGAVGETAMLFENSDQGVPGWADAPDGGVVQSGLKDLRAGFLVEWDDDAPAASSSPPVIPAANTKDAPFVNSLGMKFVPVPGTKALFSIWDTRVQDYEAYAQAQEAAGKQVGDSWKGQAKGGVPVGREPEHPVVAVSWEDAQAFCQWLTEKETTEGKLTNGQRYRLPMDEEWSTAVGLPPEPGATPEEKNGKNDVDFPWGKGWPPPKNAGNYQDESFHAKFPATTKDKNEGWIAGYDDAYATTSPVGAYPANAYGLYDLGGNVWQWCEDWKNSEHKERVLRGGSWIWGDRGGLRSSCRIYAAPKVCSGNNGFRCVLAPSASSTAAAPKDTPSAKSVDLLPLIDLQRDVVAGTWRMENGRLISDKTHNARVQLPVETPAEYDFKMVFTTEGYGPGGQVVQILGKGAAAFSWIMGSGMRGDWFGIDVIKGKTASNPENPTAKNVPEGLSKTTHTSLVEVRNSGVRVTLDGSVLADLRTDFSSVGISPNWKLREPGRLGVGSFGSITAIETLELTEISGANPPSANSSTTVGSSATATKDAPFVNALGMKFVPVPITGGSTSGQRVLFSVWETRVQDYDVFTKEKNISWGHPASGPDHPAVQVTWEATRDFCVWLTNRERSAGKISSGMAYRLPTDHEWSCAVGIGEREDAAAPPADKHQKIADQYPWGATWPPPAGVGNYNGEDPGSPAGADREQIAGYRDGFSKTAPVGSFAANAFGLFDLGGNVREWCQDTYTRLGTQHVVRDAAYLNGTRETLLSSDRIAITTTSTYDHVGFRIVLAPIKQ
jgi:formylglycine-generating enzyme required for sulfatase activity